MHIYAPIIPENMLENIHSHRIHVWYIYLHMVDFYGFHVGKYTSPMDPMGLYRGGVH